MTRVLVTGSSGFVGGQLCRSLAAANFRVRAVVRDQARAPPGCDEVAVVARLDGATNWSSMLEGVEAVVHLAAKAHDTRGSSDDSEYIEVNAEGTKALARAASGMGVRRFVYLSTIKVNGSSIAGRQYRADDAVHPDGAYGHSKWLGEKYLIEASAGTPMEPVIVRPPLVYGPGVKANFLALLRWVDKGWPLPLGSVRNRRSLISTWNLTDLIVTLLQHPRSAAGTWLVSDGRDLSTPELVELIAGAMKRRTRMFAIPTSALRLLGAAVGKGAAVDRLCGSLVVDISPTVDAFEWRPPVSVEVGLRRTVDAFQCGR